MKRIFILTVFLSLLGLGQIAAQEKYARIAVLDFSAGTGISQAEIDGLSSIFNSYFSPNAEYSIVERTRVSRILEEQNIQVAKLTEKQRVKLGEILNVSVIVIGDVNIVFDQYNVDVRAVNAQTGEIIAKDGIEVKKNSSYRDAMKTLAERISPKIPVVYLKPKPEPVEVKVNNDPYYRPAIESLRFQVGANDINFSIAYNNQLTPSFMVGGGAGIGFGRYDEYDYSWNYNSQYHHSTSSDLAVPIYLETELRTPRYEWSLFVNLKLGMYIFLDKMPNHGPYEYKYHPLLASLSVGGSWKNVNLGIGVSSGASTITMFLSYNLPFRTIKKMLF